MGIGKVKRKADWIPEHVPDFVRPFFAEFTLQFLYGRQCRWGHVKVKQNDLLFMSRFFVCADWSPLRKLHINDGMMVVRLAVVVSPSVFHKPASRKTDTRQCKQSASPCHASLTFPVEKLGKSKKLRARDIARRDEGEAAKVFFPIVLRFCTLLVTSQLSPRIYYVKVLCFADLIVHFFSIAWGPVHLLVVTCFALCGCFIPIGLISSGGLLVAPCSTLHSRPWSVCTWRGNSISLLFETTKGIVSPSFFLFSLVLPLQNNIDCVACATAVNVGRGVRAFVYYSEKRQWCMVAVPNFIACLQFH